MSLLNYCCFNVRWFVVWSVKLRFAFAVGCIIACYGYVISDCLFWLLLLFGFVTIVWLLFALFVMIVCFSCFYVVWCYVLWYLCCCVGLMLFLGSRFWCCMLSLIVLLISILSGEFITYCFIFIWILWFACLGIVVDLTVYFAFFVWLVSFACDWLCWMLCGWFISICL